MEVGNPVGVRVRHIRRLNEYIEPSDLLGREWKLTYHGRKNAGNE
jgi:hypothetical protein